MPPARASSLSTINTAMCDGLERDGSSASIVSMCQQTACVRAPPRDTADRWECSTDHLYRGCGHTIKKVLYPGPATMNCIAWTHAKQEPVYDSCSSRFCMASLEHPKDNAHRAVCECMPCPPVQHICEQRDKSTAAHGITYNSDRAVIRHEGKCEYCAERARRIAEAQQTAIRFVQRTLD